MTLPQSEQEFANLTEAFEYIASRCQGTEQYFALARVAALFDMPSKVCRQLFDMWTLMREALGGSSHV